MRNQNSTIFYEGGKKYNCRKNGKPYFRKSITIAGKRRQFYRDGEKDVLRKIKEAELLANSGFDLDTKNEKIFVSTWKKATIAFPRS